MFLIPKVAAIPPREWFIAPFEVIEQSIELILNGKIIDYKYDMENQTIVAK